MLTIENLLAQHLLIRAKMFYIFVKSLMKKNKKLTVLLNFQLFLIIMIYFVCCYYMSDIENHKIFNEELTLYVILLFVGYLYFACIQIMEYLNTFKIYNFLGLSKFKILAYNTVFYQIRFIFIYLLSLSILMGLSNLWTISRTALAEYIGLEFIFLFVFYQFAYFIAILICTFIDKKGNQDVSFFENNKN